MTEGTKTAGQFVLVFAEPSTENDEQTNLTTTGLPSHGCVVASANGQESAVKNTSSGKAEQVHGCFTGVGVAADTVIELAAQRRKKRFAAMYNASLGDVW